MKHFFLPYKKLHIWLLSALGVLLVLRLCRGNRAWMNALAEHVTIPLRRGLGELPPRWRRVCCRGLCLLFAADAALSLLQPNSGAGISFPV